jgi:hypothetical protein
MPTPPGFNNHVVKIDTPTAANINTELAAKNLAEYWATDLKFQQDGLAVFILFCRNDLSLIGETFPQKVNEVSPTQAALDADKTAEQAIGFWPPGIFPAPDGTLFILYQKLDSPPLP